MNEQDLRVVKTKKALSSSLYQLLEKEVSNLFLLMKFANLEWFTGRLFINISMTNMIC